MKIGGFQKNSLIDWDGVISAVVFTGGCNFLCPFCHNPDLVINPEAEGSKWSDTTADILEYLNQWKDWLEGVVVTGGEPTLHMDLPEFLSKIKQRGLSVKLDSNGTNPILLEEIIKEGLVDYIAMDIKTALEPESYRQACGKAVDLKAIRRSISLLMEGGCDYEFRTTVVPGFFDRDEIELISEDISGASRYVLQQFKPGACLDPEYNRREPYPDDFLRQLQARTVGRVETCFIRGEMKV